MVIAQWEFNRGAASQGWFKRTIHPEASKWAQCSQTEEAMLNEIEQHRKGEVDMLNAVLHEFGPEAAHKAAEVLEQRAEPVKVSKGHLTLLQGGNDS